VNWRTECAAVIPCLNEAATIAPLIGAVRSHLDNVIVVDDGSSDQTAALATAAGADVLSHELSQGKGAALLAGWGRARQRGFKWALTLDGDGQHAPEDIPGFFRAAERNSALLVAGNRMGAPAGMPWLRRRVNYWMSRRLSVAAGRPLPDSQCGFRLMNLQAWSSLSVSSRHFEIESEVLLAFIRARYVVEFVPVQAIYKHEQSKIQPLRDTLRWFRWWRQARRSSGDKPS
jgi:glycosyltransferase involved in cell wall biosynthesis